MLVVLHLAMENTVYGPFLNERAQDDWIRMHRSHRGVFFKVTMSAPSTLPNDFVNRPPAPPVDPDADREPAKVIPLGVAWHDGEHEDGES